MSESKRSFETKQVEKPEKPTAYGITASNSLICILSDSHDHTTAVESAIAIIRDRRPGLVIHCGDIVSPATLGLFAGLPIRAVLGNCDPNQQAFSEVCESAGLVPPQPDLEFEVSGKRCYVHHGHVADVVEVMALTSEYHYIFHGHIHLVRDVRVGAARVICPGALSRAASYSIGFLDALHDTLEIIEVP